MNILRIFLVFLLFHSYIYTIFKDVYFVRIEMVLSYPATYDL